MEVFLRKTKAALAFNASSESWKLPRRGSSHIKVLRDP
jgi:hypothetical protein